MAYEMPNKSQSSCVNMRVNVTVQALHGIQVSKGILNAQDITAAIAFTSSAKDMEVSSSTLCSTSGRLMVESLPLRSIECDAGSPISASWFEQEDLSAKKDLPHLTLSLPMSQQSQPISLSKSNRDCCIMDDSVDVGHCLNSSRIANAKLLRPSSVQCGTLKRSVPCPYSSSLQTHEALWSTSRALLPEIIELAVKVKVVGKEESQNPHGIAFLVIFRHQETGSFLMDLPVRLLNTVLDDQRSVGLTKNARLVVKVELFSQPKEPLETTTKPILSVPAVSSRNDDQLNLSSAAMEARISCLLDTIGKNEKEVMTFLQAQKRAMEIVVPVKSRDTKENALRNNTIVGATSWHWTAFIKNLFSNVDQCGVGATVKAHFLCGEDDYSIASTIATQDSFDL